VYLLVFKVCYFSSLYLQIISLISGPSLLAFDFIALLHSLRIFSTCNLYQCAVLQDINVIIVVNKAVFTNHNFSFDLLIFI